MDLNLPKVEIECPKCKKKFEVTLGQGEINGELKCSNCGHNFFLEDIIDDNINKLPELLGDIQKIIRKKKG